MTGATPGIDVECTSAPSMACTIGDNTVSNCRESGILCQAGASGTSSVTNDHMDHCGSGAAGSCLSLHSAGATVSCDANTFDHANHDCVDVGNLVLSGVPFDSGDPAHPLEPRLMITDEAGGRADVAATQDTMTILKSSLPPGAHLVVHTFRRYVYDGKNYDQELHDGAVVQPAPHVAGGGKPFTFPAGVIQITGKAGNDAFSPASVTNTAPNPMTLIIPKPLNTDFAIFPNGQVSFMAGETKTIQINYSSFKIGFVIITIPCTLPDGTKAGSFKVTGITTP